MATLDTLRPQQHAVWRDALTRAHQYDLYHLPEYAALAERRGEGRAHCFVYSEEEYHIALPLLLRSLGTVPGVGREWANLWDATSVYGYAGPVSSHPDLPDAVVRRFREELARALRELSVVSVFSRLHPLLPQQKLLNGLGECRKSGTTVSIDLTLSAADRTARYHRSHSYDLRRLRRRGVVCRRDEGFAHLPEFVATYRETMRRVEAAGVYFFDDDYFQDLVSALAPHTHLFVALAEERVVSGALFWVCDGIVQYHLSGTKDEFVKLSPSKLLVDEAASWASAQGQRVLHLGGGLGAAEDSLFRFKAGFSDRRHDFFAWRWVLDPKAHDRLCQETAAWRAEHGLNVSAPGYFPAYRAPFVKESEQLAAAGST